MLLLGRNGQFADFVDKTRLVLPQLDDPVLGRNNPSDAPTAATPNKSEEVSRATSYFAERLGKSKCDPPDTNLPRWSAFPVQNCEYEE